MSAQSTLGQLTECPLCLERYKNPKALPCQHLLCHECLVDLIEADDKPETVTCPLCREDHPIPEKGAEGFRSSFLMNDLLSQDTRDSCEECSTTKQGTSQCAHCQRQLCGDCRVKHATLTLMPVTPTGVATVPRNTSGQRQNQLPRNVDYKAKRNGPTIVLGGPNLSAEKRLTNPYGSVYSVDQDSVYVADPHNNAVRVFTADGKEGSIFCKLPNPVDIAISENSIYVLQRTGLKAFSKNTAQVEFEINDYLDQPLISCQVIQLFNDTILILDHHHKSVYFYHLERGMYVRSLSGFEDPVRMAVGVDGRIYVTDRGGWCVKIMNWDGSVYGKIDLCETMHLGICVDGDGFVCVGGRGVIKVYDPEHRYVCSIEDPAQRGGWIHHLRFMPDGRLIANDWYTNLVYLL